MFRENRKEMSHEIEMIGKRSSKGNTVIFAPPSQNTHTCEIGDSGKERKRYAERDDVDKDDEFEKMMKRDKYGNTPQLAV